MFTSESATSPSCARLTPPISIGNRRHRQHRRQVEHDPEAGGGHLAQHHVIAAQVGQEQQAQGAVPALAAQAIGRGQRTREQGVDHAHPAQRSEKLAANQEQPAPLAQHQQA